MRSRISVRVSPVAVMPWLRQADDRVRRVGRRATSSATLGPAPRVPHGKLTSVAAIPSTHACTCRIAPTLGVLAVDHPVLDRVDRDAPRLDVGRHAENDPPGGGVVAGDEQDVAAGSSSFDLSTPLALIQKRVVVLARGEVAVREAADRVEALDVAEVARARGAPRPGTAPAAARARRGACRPRRSPRCARRRPRARARDRCGTRCRSRASTSRAARAARRPARASSGRPRARGSCRAPSS